jgi:hypothetical protein
MTRLIRTPRPPVAARAPSIAASPARDRRSDARLLSDAPFATTERAFFPELLEKGLAPTPARSRRLRLEHAGPGVSVPRRRRCACRVIACFLHQLAGTFLGLGWANAPLWFARSFYRIGVRAVEPLTACGLFAPSPRFGRPMFSLGRIHVFPARHSTGTGMQPWAPHTRPNISACLVLSDGCQARRRSVRRFAHAV